MKNYNRYQRKSNLVIQNKMNDSWIKTYWRPAMAWQYFTVCLFDFLFAPIMVSLLKTFVDTSIETWKPLTLEGGGLYHLAMGAIVGITSWSRSKEKIEQMINGQEMPSSNKLDDLETNTEEPIK